MRRLASVDLAIDAIEVARRRKIQVDPYAQTAAPPGDHRARARTCCPANRAELATQMRFARQSGRLIYRPVGFSFGARSFQRRGIDVELDQISSGSDGMLYAATKRHGVVKGTVSTASLSFLVTFLRYNESALPPRFLILFFRKPCNAGNFLYGLHPHKFYTLGISTDN